MESFSRFMSTLVSEEVARPAALCEKNNQINFQCLSYVPHRFFFHAKNGTCRVLSVQLMCMLRMSQRPMFPSPQLPRLRSFLNTSISRPHDAGGWLFVLARGVVLRGVQYASRTLYGYSYSLHQEACTRPVSIVIALAVCLLSHFALQT